ncbi:conserved hypothetical protein [Ixodes scapularis]|uniref:Cilium assembly protein DZIP1 N-terminal domain-containing protein n=1 Tax=Ixodes scapularis TaxID=6945 RepID=B7P9S4_IXOSC|nr:conserved hypothetical protein [Ixodes scapularis]|eukprot:XP_002405306.1 conserved hypothetical protein [Ixodes scapularis]
MQQGQETADAASVRPVASLHGFQFHSRCQKIDWRKIASVDVDKVAREVDVDSLQKNVVHLTFCDIDNELGGALVDPNFLKLFKLAQLCMEYLMELLLQSLSDVENQVAGTSRLLEEERKFRLCDQEAIRQLQRENRKRKRIIENQQLEMLKGDKLIATGAGISREELVTRLDRLQRNCDLLFVKNASACTDGCFHDDEQVTAQASSAAVRCSTADVGMAPWGDRAGLERLSQQLQHQKQEVNELWTAVETLP